MILEIIIIIVLIWWTAVCYNITWFNVLVEQSIYTYVMAHQRMVFLHYIFYKWFLCTLGTTK